MIDDVDATLKALLATKTPFDPSAVDIRFERPDREWSASVTKPTINLFLYDLRENHELRSNERYLTRTDGTGAETRAPVRIDLSYLITAWTSDVADEHQLLGRVLATLLRFPVLPPDVLKGSMQSQPLPPRAWIAQPERMPNPWEFWGHVDHGMKAALCLVLTTSLEPHAVTEARLVTTTVLKLTETH